jgi:phage FluMu protein Com
LHPHRRSPTVSSAAKPPSRASAESLGVKGPRCRGVNPTTIIANAAFNTCLRPQSRNNFRRFGRIANRSERNGLPNCQA